MTCHPNFNHPWQRFITRCWQEKVGFLANGWTHQSSTTIFVHFFIASVIQKYHRSDIKHHATLSIIFTILTVFGLEIETLGKMLPQWGAPKGRATPRGQCTCKGDGVSRARGCTLLSSRTPRAIIIQIKKPTFYIKHHQNGSKFYHFFGTSR